jgi:glycosyltransferase involved in cell wall biosynthesis
MPESTRIMVLFGSVVLFGAERGNLEALSALKSEGAEILCLVSDERWNTIIPKTLDERGFAWRKIGYVYLAKGLSWYTLLWANQIRFMLANREFLRLVREFQPTHIHAYAQSHIVSFAWGLIRTGTPLVFRAGDEATLHNWIWRLVWKFTVWRTSIFVANSQFVAASLRASGVPLEKITVIYNRPPGRPSPQRHLELELPAAARVFAYIGQISEHKGPHVLVDAFRELAAAFPQAHLLLAGRISDWEGDAWARTLRDASIADPLIADRITFLGLLAAKRSLYHHCLTIPLRTWLWKPSRRVRP